MQIHVKQLATSGAASGEVLAFNGTNWAPATAPNGAIGGTVTGATAGSVLFAGVAGVLAQDNANFFWNNTDNHLYIGSTTPTLPSVLSVTGGTLTGTVRALYADGTLSTTANQFLATLDATSGGSTASIFKGSLSANMLAGYTGVGGTVAGSFTNDAAGTDSWEIVTNPTYGTQLGNAGFVSIARGVTAGTNLGAHISAQGSSASNTGLLVVATSSTNSPLRNYGILAFAQNGSSANIAGVFSLSTTTSLTSAAAFIADNGAETAPVFIGRDGGVEVFAIKDGGNIDQTTSKNGDLSYQLLNTNGGGSAEMSIYLNAGGSAYSAFKQSGSGFTPIGLRVANQMTFFSESGNTGGILFVAVNSSAPIIFNAGGDAATQERFRIKTSESVFNDNAQDADFRVEGSGTRPDLFLVDAGTARVGINRAAGTHASTLDVDNLAVAEPILNLRDNGTVVWTMKDGGDVDHFVAKNSALAYEFRNTDGGGSAEISLYLNAGGTAYSALKQNGTGFTTNGLRVANQLVVYSETGNTGGMLLANVNSAPIYFTIGGVVASAERLRLGNTESVFNDNGQDVDWRAEGSGTRPNLLLVDAGTARVGINRAAGTHASTLDVDNLAVAEPILNLRDNGSVVFGVIDGGSVEMAEISAPATPSANFGRLYVKAKAATNSIYYLDDAGTEFDLTAGSFGIGGTITGATAGSVLFAGAAGVLAQDNANFFWDDSGNKLQITRIDITNTNLGELYMEFTSAGSSNENKVQHLNDTSAVFQLWQGASNYSLGGGSDVRTGDSKAGLLNFKTGADNIYVTTSAAHVFYVGFNVANERLSVGDTTIRMGTDGSASAPVLTLGATADSNTGIFHPAADTLALSTGGTERMRWDANGNVGIGLTATSGYKLHVGGSNILLTNTGTNADTFFSVYDSSSLVNSNYILFGIDTTGSTTGYSGQGAFMSIGANGTGTVRDLILHNFNNAGVVLASNNTERGRMTGGGVWQLAAATGYQTLATSPSQITANQNDYNPGTGVYFRLSSDASRDITGIANGVDGRRITLVNVGSNDIVLKNADTNSAAANRLLTGTGADVTLGADDSAELVYDATTSRWRFTSIKL